jgi:electron transfer flavoprotein alpha subunit
MLLQQTNANVIVFSHNQTGKAVAARVAATKLKAGLVAGACALPDTAMVLLLKKQYLVVKHLLILVLHLLLKLFH